MSVTPCPEKIKDIFVWKTKVATYDVGPDRLLTPSAQLRLQQEAGELHFGEGNLNFEGVAAAGFAFVVAQNNAVITRRPAVGEEITVMTWSQGVVGARFYRSYRFEDANGNTLIESTASFVLVDVHEHKLLRPSQFPFEVKHAGARGHGCPNPPKLRMPKESEYCGKHNVMYSQLDFNGHLNNTRYADIVFDHLPEDSVAKMTGFSIAFLKEARLHDTLTLKKAVCEDGAILIEATGQDTVCFAAQVRFN